jgi:hypothetical protein
VLHNTQRGKMSSLSFHGKLTPSVEDAFPVIPFRDDLDLGNDGTQLLWKDDEDVSYFAEVAGGKVTHLFCTDSSGTRLPSFTLTGKVKNENVCYLCWVKDGQKYSCTPIPCQYA